MLEEVLDRDIISSEIMEAIQEVQVVDFSEEYIDEKLDSVDDELPEIVKDMEAVGVDYVSRNDIWDSYFEQRVDPYYNSDEELTEDERIAEKIRNFNYEDAQEYMRETKFKHLFGINDPSILVETNEDKVKGAYEEWKKNVSLGSMWSFVAYELA